MNVSLLIVFWAMQIVSQIIYKAGSASPRYWIVGFVLGNVIGVSSMWLMMKLYTKMDSGLAMGLGIGGAFLFSQLAFAIVFSARIGWQQAIAYGLMALGMILAGIEK